jgi:hypothetical protein
VAVWALQKASAEDVMVKGFVQMRNRGVAGLVALGFGGVLAGCMTDPELDAELESSAEYDSFGTLEQPLCENKGGTNAVMTGLAVATGKELRRWAPETDFKWNTSTGMLELSATGLARCPGGKCPNTQALLDMQRPEANGKVKFPGNITLDSNLLKSLLKSGWSAQASCTGPACAPAHDLRFAYVEEGSCDKKFFFDPLKAGTSTRLPAPAADKLKNKLKFLGYPSNKMLNFYLRDGQVSVDPTYGLNEGAAVRGGSCEAACTKYSTTNKAGQCCSCNGATKKFVKAKWNASTYTCG